MIGSGLIFLRGTVTSTAPLMVRLDTAVSEAEATRLASWTPTLDHRVICAMVGTSLVVFGQEV